MAKLTCRRKLQVELKAFLTSPPPFLPLVAVSEDDICVWHYLLQGPPDTPYEGGWYIGKLRFPVRHAAQRRASNGRRRKQRRRKPSAPCRAASRALRRLARVLTPRARRSPTTRSRRPRS